MTRKKKGLLSLLIFTPLLMSNSPAPFVPYYRYDKIEANLTYKESLGNSKYLYEVTIKNIGDTETDISSIDLYYNDNSVTYLSLEDDRIPFANLLISPNQEITLNYTTNALIDLSKTYNITTEYYSDEFLDSNIVFKNISVEKSGLNGATLKYDAENQGNYYYSNVVFATYDGEDYIFSTRYSSDTFYFSENFDIDKLSINSIKSYKTPYSKYEYRNVTGRALILLFLLPLGIIGILMIISIIIIVHVHRVNRKRNKDHRI